MGVSAEVRFHLQPECHDQVQNYGWPERQEGRVDKIKSDAAGRDIHLFPQPGADAKRLFLNEVSDSFHTGLIYRANSSRPVSDRNCPWQS